MTDETLQPNNDSQPQVTSLPETPALVKPPAGLWAGTEPIGSITSPSDTSKYRMVLRDYAATVQLEGSLVCLDYEELDSQGQKVKKTVLCQISKMALRNRHHENPILGPIIREKGRIPGLSGFADQKEASLIPMDSIIAETETHQLPRNIPSTGTNIRLASASDVKSFSGTHKALFNIGYLYETKVPVGLMLKHFGPGENGWGDARMLGVFGATGSGKSVMAASIIAGFAARHEMGLFIIDPQGQLSGFEMGKDPKNWSWRLDEAFRVIGRGPDVKLVKIGDISFQDPFLFAQLLVRFDFFDAMGIPGHEKQKQLETDLSNFLWMWLEQEDGRQLGQIQWSPEVMSTIIEMGASVYADPEKKKLMMTKAFEAAPYKMIKASNIWEQVRQMFDRPYNLDDLMDDVLIKRKIVILDVDADEGIKDLYCRVILNSIKRKAESIYRIKQGQPWRGDLVNKYKDTEINALIVIDEAQRFAPEGSGRNDDQEKILQILEDAIKTTRKLGVGWLYITQSIADFNKRIFRQIQTKILGIGIGTGADNQHLETAFNEDKDLIERYRSLPRPITTNIYPFAIIGELVALGNGTKPLFISATSSQQELFDLNLEHFKYRDGKPVSKQSNPPDDTTRGRLPAPLQQLAESNESDSIPF